MPSLCLVCPNIAPAHEAEPGELNHIDLTYDAVDLSNWSPAVTGAGSSPVPHDVLISYMQVFRVFGSALEATFGYEQLRRWTELGAVWQVRDHVGEEACTGTG